ncbi:hypothetical protein ACFYRC_14425 [Streptomyces sp. NPDC005279]|uniref:hypothetical protein n=1 Tax=Streptomyces sp. NPDC005279 TaxID=3364712 RepID=UPI00367983A7
MTTTADSGHDIALALIAQDAMFLRRFANSITADQEQAVVPIFCMHNYMCLIIHESHRALRHVAPDLADVLAYDCAPAIERARHSVKLFDDKYKGLADVSADFRRIIDEHRQEFLNNTWLPLARPLERDLVLWRYRGRLVSTSHTASFFLALPPQSFKNLDVLGPEVQAIAIEQGSYIAAAANGLPWEEQSFLDTFQKTDLAEGEIRAEKYYRRRFDPALPEEVKASLTAMTCALNTVGVLLADETGQASAVTLWKLRYITLHHVLSSLRKLDEQYGAELRPPDQALLKEILNAPTSRLVLQTHGGFRNTLVHYRPERRVREQLSLHAPLYGLLDAYFPAEEALALRDGLAPYTAHVADRMEAWSGD